MTPRLRVEPGSLNPESDTLPTEPPRPVVAGRLPIEKDITFKPSTFYNNIKSTGQPSYRRELLSDYQPVSTLRSSSKHLFTVNVAETVLTIRGFRHSAVAV
jgi:hypothetical protein